MSSLDSLETPALIIDLDRLEYNIAEMANLCQRSGVALRPHAKTHKSLEIARLQQDHGAVGITVAKLSEAEVFVEGGIADIFIAYPIVGPQKLERLIALARRAKISTIVDDAGSAGHLAAAAAASGVAIDVLIELDLGLHRVGVSEAAVARLAHRVAELSGVRLRGVCIHEGNVYGERDSRRRAELARSTAKRLVDIAERLRDEGLSIDVVSCGATPAVKAVVDVPGLTEVRPGNYVFYDAMQVALGVVSLDRCALSVLSTVVSRRDCKHAIIDAGSKVFSVDRGAHGLGLVETFGTFPSQSDRKLVALSEEHGWMEVPPDDQLSISDRVDVIPNHACTAAANFALYSLVRGGELLGTWEVSARGRTE